MEVNYYRYENCIILQLFLNNDFFGSDHLTLNNVILRPFFNNDFFDSDLLNLNNEFRVILLCTNCIS